MKKWLILSLWMIALTVPIYAVFVEEGTTFSPSATNATYVFRSDQTVSSILVNSTCVTIDGTSLCYTPTTPYSYDLYATPGVIVPGGGGGPGGLNPGDGGTPGDQESPITSNVVNGVAIGVAAFMLLKMLSKPE